MVLFIFLSTMLLAASTGMWLFFVQFQFEPTSSNSETEWNVYDAALEGSFHCELPPILRRITETIGVQNLASRVPFHSLPEVLRDHDALANSNHVTLRESLGSARLAPWDPSERRLVTLTEARRLAA